MLTINLFQPVFSDWFLYSPAALFRDIMALFLSLQVTNSTLHIVNLGLCYCITYLTIKTYMFNSSVYESYLRGWLITT